MELLDAYKSLIEAIDHAGIHHKAKVNIRYIDAEDVERKGVDVLAGVDAILVPGGFGERGVEGKILTVQYARENNVPYLGICLGMQVAVIEFARNIAGLSDAHSTEFNLETPNPVIALITEWLDEDGNKQIRDDAADLGGSMRLGAQQCHLVEGTNTYQAYQAESINERHRHRYEVNANYVETLQDAGLRIAGWSADNKLVEVVEIKSHPWFVACQFHPEFTSTPRDGHPLFSGFVNAAIQYADQQADQ